MATDWKVRGSNPGGGENFRTCPDRPWGPPRLMYNGYRVLPGRKERPGRDADPSLPSSAVVKEEQSYTSTPPMDRTACTEPQCLYKGALYLFFNHSYRRSGDSEKVGTLTMQRRMDGCLTNTRNRKESGGGRTRGNQQTSIRDIWHLDRDSKLVPPKRKCTVLLPTSACSAKQSLHYYGISIQMSLKCRLIFRGA